MREKTDFKSAGKIVTLYPARQPGAPMIILNNFSGDGSSVVSAMEEIGCGDCYLASIGNLNWDHDMTPWYCPALSPNDKPCTGRRRCLSESAAGADLLPDTLSRISGRPAFLRNSRLLPGRALRFIPCTIRIVFPRAASMSGSSSSSRILWSAQSARPEAAA